MLLRAGKTKGVIAGRLMLPLAVLLSLGSQRFHQIHPIYPFLPILPFPTRSDVSVVEFATTKTARLYACISR